MVSHMLHAVIDIGSNTIRLSVYDCSNPEKPLQKAGGRAVAGLAARTENGALTEEGVKRLCDSLTGFREILERHKPDSLFVFATASLRNISNSAEVLKKIKEQTGFSVEILQGAEEAELDFAGAMLGTELSEGLVADIGGGSSELICFQNRKQGQCVSLPIGSLKLYKSFVSGLLPTREEAENICAETKRLLEASGMKRNAYRTVLGVGGTLRNSAKLCRAFGCGTAEAFAVSEFQQLLNRLCSDREAAERMLRKIVPERLDSMLPGMLLFRVIADYFSCEQVEISMFGVREGFLTKRILNAESENKE